MISDVEMGRRARQSAVLRLVTFVTCEIQSVRSRGVCGARVVPPDVRTTLKERALLSAWQERVAGDGPAVQ